MSDWFRSFPKSIRAVLIVSICILLCIAVLLGIMLQTRSERQEYIDYTIGRAMDAYRGILLYSDRIIDCYVTNDSDYVLFLPDLLRDFQRFDVYFWELRLLTDISEQYPRAAEWLQSIHISYRSEAELESLDFGLFYKYYTLLRRAHDDYTSFEETMERLENELTALPEDYFQ